MIKKIAEGFVFRSDKDGPVACVPRTVLLKSGELICTYMSQTKIGANDSVPMISVSSDGERWSESRPVWPQFTGRKSSFVSARPMPDGRVSLAGFWFDIAGPGEDFWSDEANGMKENHLIWCVSEDGRNFPEPHVIEVPYYASAEQPGGMLVKRTGEMIIIYAPCQTIEKREDTITNRIVMLTSRDNGKTFEPKILGGVSYKAMYAESWITELGNGTVVAGSWQIDDGLSPDVYFISKDGGETFKGPFDMGFRGQTTSLTPYGDDSLLVPYNQRKEGTLGVWLSIASPDENSFNLSLNTPVWEASVPTRSNTSGDFSEWTDYSFGEPQVTILPDGNLLLVFWCDQPDGKGIRYIKLSVG